MDIIKTRYKSKVSKGFSYPVGAELLSKHFADVAQYSELELSFDGRAEYWTSKFNKTIKVQGDIIVLKIEYENNRPGFSASKNLDYWYGEHWKMRIYSVPRDVKGIVRSELIENFLPMTRKWLNQKYKNKNSDYSRFDVRFNIKTHSFNMSESEKR